MPTARRALVALLATSLAVAGTLVAAPSATAATAPLAPVALHPDGRSPFETARPSPVTFELSAAPGDTTGATATRHVVVQQPSGASWRTVADVRNPGSPQVALPEGPGRWHARFETTDGTAGPWSRWMSFTVDSRTPAAPVVSVPAGNPTDGVPVPVTITSPDALATVVVLSSQEVPLVFARGQDPCGTQGAVCIPAGQSQVTVPWAFEDGWAEVWVTAYGRNGTMSPTIRAGSGFAVPDTTAADTATNWRVPTTATATADVRPGNGGPALRIAPLVPASQEIYVGGGDLRAADPDAGSSTVAVPSAVVASDTGIRSLGVAVDTASAFTMGGAFTVPSGAHGEMTVMAQPGYGGPAAALLLTASDGWDFCVYLRSGSGHCAGLFPPGGGPGETDVIAGHWDPVTATVTVSVDVSSATSGSGVGVRSAPRAAVGGLRIGAPVVTGTSAYTGPVGSPFVARGWLTPDQAKTLVTSSP